ncbi:MAG: alpha/beta fold hydrolase [Nocardioidaceae bacterium]
MREHTVEAGDVRLCVREHGSTGADNVVLVHGYPDTQAMWDPVVARLSDGAGLHVVTYDVRGAGASTPPATLNGYRIAHLVDDLVAVIDVTCPGEPVHLVGHDWGSVQLWDAVTAEDSDPRLRGRIASFTSISGPCLDHVAAFSRAARSRHQWRRLLAQARRSWYVYAFLVPWLPEQVWRHASGAISRRIDAGQGLRGRSHWAPTLARDGANGVNLYRANLRSGARRRGTGRTDVPVLTIVPRRDAFLTPALYDDLDSFVSHSRRVEVEGAHWIAVTDPDQVADLVTEHVRAYGRA